MIPKFIYFIFFRFGISPESGEKPFGLVHFLAIKSAKIVNKCDVFLYYENPLDGNVWWEATKKYCTHVKCNAPVEVGGNLLTKTAYKSDVLRLQLLNETGGIYFDIDTISIKPIDDLLSAPFVMGKETVRGKTLGLCNAVMMGEKKSRFSELWLEQYYTNYDSRWGHMSVHRSYQLALQYPDSIKVKPEDYFFKYTWILEDLELVHTKVVDMGDAYILHLWEQPSFDLYLQFITPESIRQVDTTYNLLARPFLE